MREERGQGRALGRGQNQDNTNQIIYYDHRQNNFIEKIFCYFFYTP